MKRMIQYIVIAFGFSWLNWGLQYLGQEGITPEWTQLFGMFGVFGPFVAFLIMVKLDGDSIKESFKKLFQRPPTWTIIFALISPMILSGLAYIVYLGLETGTSEPIGVTLLSFIPIALFILFVGGPIEEFGWRGYLLPRLRSTQSIVITILMMGFIHGIWHLPLHFLNGTVQEALPIYEYLIVTVAITVSYVFLYEYTKSLIPAIALHWFANYSSAIFPYFYSVEGRYALLMLTLALDIVLLYLLSKRTSLIQKQDYSIE